MLLKDVLLLLLLLIAAPAVTAQPRFAYTELPTLTGGPDVPTAIALVGTGSAIIVGSADAGSGALQAVAWECTGALCTLVQLPSATPSSAAGISCNGVGDCVAVGWVEGVGGLHQPLAYSRTGGLWSAEPLPLSAGDLSGEALAIAVDSSGRAAACGKKDEKSTCWIRVSQVWSNTPLPDLGAASAALGMGTSPSDGTTLLVVGRAQNTSGRVVPVLWQEVLGGSFGAPVALPLAVAEDAEAIDIEALDADTYLVTGTGLFTSGEVGLLWQVDVAGGDPDLPIVVGSIPNATSIHLKGSKIRENFAAFPGSTDGPAGRRGALALWDFATSPETHDLNDLVTPPPSAVIESANDVALGGGGGSNSLILIAEASASPTRAVLLQELTEAPALPGTATALLALAIALTLVWCYPLRD